MTKKTTTTTTGSIKAPPSIIKAMNSKALFQPWFDGASWNGWKSILKAMDALPMTGEETTFFRSVAGGRNPPTRPVREFWAACARRTGKDLRPYLPFLRTDGDLGKTRAERSGNRDPSGSFARRRTSRTGSLRLLV